MSGSKELTDSLVDIDEQMKNLEEVRQERKLDQLKEEMKAFNEQEEEIADILKTKDELVPKANSKKVNFVICIIYYM